MSEGAFKALLVAAGIGSRLRPVTDVLPKCLVPVNGRPLLGLWLEKLFQGGATEVVVNLHHHADLVREYLRRSPFAARVTPVFEPELLGTGGTLLRNRERLSGAPFLFAHADNLSSFDVLAMADSHRTRPANVAMTMMTFEADDPRQCGIVELDASGIVRGFHEKSQNPPGNVANAAVFMLDPEVIDYVASLGRPFAEFSTDVIPHFIGRIATFHNDTYHRDIGSLLSLLQAQIDYPLAVGAYVSTGAGDPWFGLMDENGGRLRRALVETIASALRQGAG